MSRIGKLPIPILSGVTITQDAERHVLVKGPKGQLELSLRPEIDLELDAKEARLTPNGTGDPRRTKAYHGLTRALLQNMVVGVSRGYTKSLDIVGVGWNAQAQKTKVVLNIGYCHQVEVPMPKGIEVETPSPTTVVVKGVDKQAVGQTAAIIRSIRPPEPYKGKGIRYQGEFVRRKAGKSFGS